MSIFMLDTDAVSSCGSSLKSLASDMSSISDSVNGYDINCDDNFDFSSAKSVISKNIEACSIKISNSYNYVEQVVSSHAQLQNSLKFAFPGEEKEKSSMDSDESADGYSSNYSYSGGGGSYVGGTSSHSGGGNSNNTSHNNKPYKFSNLSKDSSIQPSPVLPVIDPNKENNTSKDENLSDKNNNADNNSTDVVEKNTNDNNSTNVVKKNTNDNNSTNVVEKNTTDISNQNSSSGDSTSKDLIDEDMRIHHVGYAYADVDNLTVEAKKIFNDDKFKYVDGYGKIGNRYVISCDKSYGKVGDVIRFEQNDGSSVECIVGVVTTGNNYKNSANFIVDKNNLSSVKPLDVVSKLVTDNHSIANQGYYQSNDNNSAFGFIFNKTYDASNSSSDALVASQPNNIDTNHNSISGEEAL